MGETQQADAELDAGTEDEQQPAEPADPDDAGTDDELDDAGTDDEQSTGDGESFPRVYVEQLRRKQQTYRHRAKVAERRAEQLARELYRSRVADLGLLADPDDMAYDDELLMNGERLREAVTELVRTKPHLAARRVSGNIGQHDEPAGSAGPTLGAILRANA